MQYIVKPQGIVPNPAQCPSHCNHCGGHGCGNLCGCK